MGNHAVRGPAAQHPDLLAERWSVVVIRSDGPLIKEAGQIASWIVAGMDVELGDSELIAHWGNERWLVGKCVHHNDRWTIADTREGDLVFGGERASPNPNDVRWLADPGATPAGFEPGCGVFGETQAGRDLGHHVAGIAGETARSSSRFGTVRDGSRCRVTAP